MATDAFEDIVADFEFMDDWEDRYRYVIELGKAMDPLDDAFKVDANKVHGCASQVWMQHYVENGVYRFDGDSDAMIVRGLVALLRKLVNGVPVGDVGAIDITAELTRLELASNLSSQRSNGLRSMVEKIRDFTAAQ
ncbi:MAG: SufE family protein [Rhodobacteraceae bacterium]|jgi:cysteine desulfuration protein SufE|nr:SufE family protein [Paracoccaceae bacterium]